MYLKRLELLGFKTFVSRTEFVFDSGITAIVGPNGSGKSNVADALRWVLGEQSTRPLRIKRTEDVIFGGSAARTRLGMAEVSVTFDNTGHWLPVDYDEVTVTRRAYRSGENEYFVNRGRVRLRDVVDLLLAGNIGQNNYTVIGQGTVDAALSLRPEERRGLFEEAADIKRYQLKRSDALEKLAATEANLVRIGDILAEIGPRVQLLKEQARRAQEHAALTGELRGYLAAWYRHLWSRAQEALAAAQAREAEALAALAGLQAESDERAARLAALREQEQQQRASLSEWHRQASDVHAQLEALERQLAVDRERSAQTERQRQDLLQELAALEAAAEGEAQRLSVVRSEIVRLEAESRQRAERARAIQAEVAAQLDERRRCERELDAAQEQSFALASSVADARQRLASLSERRGEISRALEEHAQAVASATAQSAAVGQQLAVTVADLAALDTQASALARERESLQAALKQSQDKLAVLQAVLGERQQARQAAQTRFELLSRLQRSGDGYVAGVRAVLAASGSRRLNGIVGTVASLIQVPAEMETAIETGLGGHMQDIVVETWDDAAAAIGFLKESRSGRCTFWPLNAVRSPYRGGRPTAIQQDGVLGWALDLITFSERYRCVLSHLLGNTMVVRDLAAARAVSAAGIQATLVTLGGELVRPAGSVTGGVAERSGGGVLAREREVRELPAQIAALEREVAQAQAALDRERLHGQQVATQVSVLEAQQHDLATRRVAQSAEEAARRQQAARVDQEVAWRESLRKQAETELAALDRREAEIGAGLAATQERQKAVQAQVEDLRKRLEGLDVSAAQAALAEARTEAAVGEQALRSQRAMLSNLEAGYARLLEQVAAKRDRATDLSNQNADLAARIETAQRRAELLSAELGELRLLIEPVEAAMALAQTQQAELSAEESAARPRLLQAERAATQAGMEVTRCQEDLAKLQAQIEAEESLRLPEGAGGAGADAAGTVVSDELPEMADFPHQLRLNLNGAGGRVLPLAAVQETPPTPEQIKRQVDRLRAQIRALGAINANAVAEYEETQKRFTFLSTQADDLQQASRSLKAVVAELDGVMKKRFTETFRAVAEEFKRYFSLLFNGGTARLALTDPDDPQMTGIDIVAQPPGKRMQSLALLSGGERALTATALLFSILTVNPTPFCVLDEVDAALDEANVGRFTQALKNLAQRTQFVVITHNRGTMEIASTLYGVSMGEDGASRLISLRLEEAEAQARKR